MVPSSPRVAGPVSDWNWLAPLPPTELDFASGFCRVSLDDRTHCAPPWAPAAACGSCARTPGNASPPLFSPPPSKSSKSARFSRCFANVTATRFPFRRDTRPPSHFPPPRDWQPSARRNCEIAKWVFVAPYLLATARVIAAGQLDLTPVATPARGGRPAPNWSICPGVGSRKIADCVYVRLRFPKPLFPVDV